MPDENPQNLRRMLRLRQFPLFETVDLDELATIAENLVDTEIPAGSVIAAAGSRLPGIHLVIDGHIETRPRGPRIGPRQVFGALEVLATRDASYTAVAATDLHTLRISARDIGEVLEDNFGVLLTVLRVLATQLLALGGAQRPVALALAHPLSASPLGLVERLIVLRQLLPFSRARLQALATLAHASEEVSWPAGTILAQANELATRGIVIISGAAIASHGDVMQRLEPGTAIGHVETLGGLAHATRIETATPVRALCSGAPAMFDVLEDHTDVGLAMMWTFANALLDAAPRFN